MDAQRQLFVRLLHDGKLGACVNSWHDWSHCAELVRAWEAAPLSVQAQVEASPNSASRELVWASQLAAAAAARRWRWATGLAAPERRAEARARLADAYRLRLAEEAVPLPPNLPRFVRRARRRCALPGWWTLNEHEDDALACVDATPLSADALASRYSAEELQSLRDLATDVYGALPGGQRLADDSEDEDEEDDETVADAAAACVEAHALDATAMAREGDAALESGDSRRAVQCYTAALMVVTCDEHQSRLLYLNRGIAYFMLRCWRRALTNVQALFSLAPCDMEGHLLQASVLAVQGRVAAAAAALAQDVLVRWQVLNAPSDFELSVAEQARSRLGVLVAFWPQAEHCAAVLRFIVPHVVHIAPDLALEAVRYARGCIAHGGADAAVEFDACGGCLAARVLLSCGPEPQPWHDLQLPALLDDVAAALRGVGRAPTRWPAEDHLTFPQLTHIYLPLYMAAHFTDVHPLVAALEQGPSRVCFVGSPLQRLLECGCPPFEGGTPLSQLFIAADGVRALCAALRESLAPGKDNRCNCQYIVNVLFTIGKLEGAALQQAVGADLGTSLHEALRVHGAASAQLTYSACLLMAGYLTHAAPLRPYADVDGVGQLVCDLARLHPLNNTAEVLSVLAFLEAVVSLGGARVRCHAIAAGMLPVMRAALDSGRFELVKTVVLTCRYLPDRSKGYAVALLLAELASPLIAAADALLRTTDASVDDAAAVLVAVDACLALSNVLQWLHKNGASSVPRPAWLPDAMRLALRLWYKHGSQNARDDVRCAAWFVLLGACHNDREAAIALEAWGVPARLAGSVQEIAPDASPDSNPGVARKVGDLLLATCSQARHATPAPAPKRSALAFYGTPDAPNTARSAAPPKNAHMVALAAMAQAVLDATDGASDEAVDQAAQERFGALYAQLAHAAAATAAPSGAELARLQAAADAAAAALLAEEEAEKSGKAKDAAKKAAKKQRQKAAKQAAAAPRAEDAGGAGPSQPAASAADALLQPAAVCHQAVAAAAPMPPPPAALPAPAHSPAAPAPSAPPAPAAATRRTPRAYAPPRASASALAAQQPPASLLPPLQSAAQPPSTDDADLQELLGHLQLTAAPSPPLTAPPPPKQATLLPPAAAEEMPEECCVCLNAPPAATLAPCGHTATCAACTERVLQGNALCPMCRCRIVSYALAG